jgi:pimeloyl-ACP methyl ester carboxylesterase
MERVMSTSTRDEVDLHYEQHGSGEPLLLIHGFGASTYSWRFVTPALAKQHRVIALDLKGFGASPKPERADYSAHEQVNLAASFVRKHDVGGMTLVGHSFGGAVALLLALALATDARYRPKRLILIDTAAYPQRLPFFMRVLRNPLLGRLAGMLLPDRVQVRHVLKLAYYDDTRIPDEAVTVYAKALGMPGGRTALRLAAAHLVPPDIDEITARFSRIDIPTLIVWGRQDAIVPLAVGERLHWNIPASKMVVIDRCGHIPHEECPEAALRVVLDFLNEHPTDGR